MKNYTKKITEKQIKFKGIQKKVVRANFSGGCVSSDAGLLLLRQIEAKRKILSGLSKCIEDRRHQSYIDHPIETILKQRVYAIAAGYEDGNDHAELRNDVMFKIAVNKDPGGQKALASPSTICRLENSVTREDEVRMSKEMVEQFIRSHRHPPSELILDFDATDDPVHGDQVGRFFHGYYDKYCFLPLYVFCGRKLLVAYLRPANQDAARHAWAILSLLVKRFRQVWPGVKIIFRGDCGFCRHKILNWCERNNVNYVVGIAKNDRLKAIAEPIIERSRTIYEAEKKKVREFGEIIYAAKTWKRERRVIVKAEQLSKGENLRFVVTNISVRKPEKIYDKLYILRGDMENRIKERQLYLFSDRTSCHDFTANQFRLLLSSAAYILYEEMRSMALTGTELAKAQCSTLRLKLIKIGAIIVYTTRRILVKLSESFVYKELFYRVAAAYT